MLVPIDKNMKILSMSSIDRLKLSGALKDRGEHLLNMLYLHTEDIVQKILIERIFDLEKWKLNIPDESEIDDMDPDPPRYA